MFLRVLICLGNLLYHLRDALPHPSTMMFCPNRPTVMASNNLDIWNLCNVISVFGHSNEELIHPTQCHSSACL